MELNILIILVFLLLLFFRYKEGVILISILSPWLYMWKFPIGNTLNLFVVLACVAILLLITKRQLSYVRYFPFKVAVIFPFVSLIVTSIFIRFKLVPLLELLSYYIFPFVLFCVIQTPKELNAYLKCLSVFLVLIVGYTIFEELTYSNPIMDWCVNHKEQFSWVISTKEIRFGVKRAQSFLMYSSALGGLCNYSFFVIAYLKSKRYKYTNSPVFNFLLYALPICSFLTGTRSVIFPFMIICIGFINLKTIERYKFTFLIVAIIAIFPMHSYLSKLGDSILASDDEKNQMGSSQDMREEQFAVATYYMDRSPSPWYGNGLDYTDKVKKKDWKLRGAESIWMPRMIEQGYIGVISLVLTFVIMLLLLFKYKMYACLWVMLSFIMGKTISAMLGIEEGYYLLIFVVIFRYLQFTNRLPSKLIERNMKLRMMLSRADWSIKRKS